MSWLSRWPVEGTVVTGSWSGCQVRGCRFRDSVSTPLGISNNALFLSCLWRQNQVSQNTVSSGVVVVPNPWFAETYITLVIGRGKVRWGPQQNFTGGHSNLHSSPLCFKDKKFRKCKPYFLISIAHIGTQLITKLLQCCSTVKKKKNK